MSFSKNKMRDILFSGKLSSVITFYKRIYNRARPHQVAPQLLNYENGNLLKSQSASTPSYPSGHAVQSYYLARHLALHFPAKRNEFIAIAKRISDIRIMAGLHFPSDRDFAWWLVDKMF
jgi:membrane-associated phospholipid phosphatase